MILGHQQPVVILVQTPTERITPGTQGGLDVAVVYKMPSPAVNMPPAQSAHKPKRRQRNTSEDSLALRHNPKRLRRSGLTSETFEPPESTKANGHVNDQNSLSHLNGHASNQRDAASDTASLAIRNRRSDKVEKRRGGSREEGTVLVGHDQVDDKWQRLMR